MSGVLAGWRLALRLACREAVRRKAQTALMLVLISLPVLAVSAAAVAWQTADVSRVEALDRQLGSADALLRPESPGPLVQHFHPEDGTSWQDPEGEQGRLATWADVRQALGDRPAVAVRTHWLSYETDRGEGEVEVTETALDDPLTAGLFRRVSGRATPGPGEVVVNRALAERGPEVGEELVIGNRSGDQATLRVVGIAESTTARSRPVAVVAPGSLGAAVEQEAVPRSWLVGGGPVTWDDVRALNRLGVVVTSRAVVTDPPPESELPPDLVGSGPAVDQVTLTVLALVVVMVLIEVVLLAGPAFAVRARKQAHALALIAAAGGTPAQARRVVLATGVVIGVLGGAVGVVLGIGVGFLAVPVVQRVNHHEYLGPFDVPWSMLAVVAAFGLVSALLAAVVPAVIASRQDVVAVLAGRRGEGRPSTRSPYVGLGLLAVGVAAAAIGAQDRQLAPVLIAGSAIVSVFGMILLVPVVVVLAARLAARLPLPLRFAARDAARHRTRTVPAVAAVAATVAGVVALGIAVASQEAASRAAYQPQLAAGQGVVTLPGGGDDAAAVRELVVSRLPDATLTPVASARTEDDRGRWREISFRAGGEELVVEYWGSYGSSYLVGDRVPAIVGLSAAEQRRADRTLAAGGVVLLAGTGADTRPIDRVAVVTKTYVEETGEERTGRRLPAAATWARVDRTIAPAQAVLPPELVSRLGMRTTTSAIAVDGVISEAAEQDVVEGLAALGSEPYFYVERGYEPDPAIRIVQLILAVLGAALMLGGTLTATFLALSDARPDLATMAAVGARPRTRRGVAASYALVVGLAGALLGAPVGFVPGIAVSAPLTWNWETGETALELPWLLIGVVVLGLPLLTAGVVGLCARSRLPMVARID